jgi:hypothetical protein
MITASHYVIQNMSSVLDKKDLSGSKEVFEKFLRRYGNDKQLRGICDDFMRYAHTRDPEMLGRVRSELEELRNTRKRERYGSMDLGRRKKYPGVVQFFAVLS